MDKIIVGLSGINAVDNPGPGVGIARALKKDKELGVSIVGLAYDAMDPGIYMDWLIDASYIMPYPSSGHDTFIQRLRYIKNNFGLDVIIPSLDVELPLYTKYQAEIARLGITLFLPTLEQFRLRGKDRLAEVAGEIGIRIPRTRLVTSYGELTRAVDTIGLPVMIKGAFYGAFRAETGQEAVGFYNRIVAEWGYPVIVQQLVSGEELNVVGVGNGTGGSLGLVGIKKMWTTSLGKIWTGVTIRNEQMLTAAREFIRRFQWKGPFELECIASHGSLHLIEINPRFPAWSYFAAGVGINLPANMLRKALGLPLQTAAEYRAGKLFVRYTYEMITDMETFQGMITKGEHKVEKQL